MRTRGFCFALLVLGMLAVGCSSAAATAGPYEPQYPVAYPAATMAAAATVGDYTNGSDVTTAPAVAGGDAAASAALPMATGLSAPAPESQIIKTGTITIQVEAIDNSIIQATDLIHTLGGWLSGSDRTTRSAYDMASITFRIPVDRFEDSLSQMRKLGTKVLGEHTESTPVGGQIVDLQSRISNLKASEKAIQAIMSKANTIGDTLTVEQRLADVQGQIEQLTGQLNGQTDQSAYSTLTVILEVPVIATPSQSPSPSPTPSPTATPVAWSAGTQAGQAAESLGQVGQSVATILIWFGILVLPVLLVLLILLVILVLAGRKLDPYRRRLLPFTAPAPTEARRPAQPQGWPVPAAPPVPFVPFVPGPPTEQSNPASRPQGDDKP